MKIRHAIYAVVGTVAAYGLLVGVVAPPIAKKIMAERLGERIGRKVAIDELSVNPYTLNATLAGFRIFEPDGTTRFASFERLDLDGSAMSFYRLAPVADQVYLAGLKVNLVRDGDSHYNVSDIIERVSGKRATEEEHPSFSLSNIRVANARLDFDDRPKGRKHALSEMNVAIPFLSSLPRHLKEYVQPVFSANVNGAPLHIRGETQLFQDSLRTHIALDLDALEIPRYVEYSPSPLPVKVDAGKLDAHVSVRFLQAAGGKAPSIDISGKVAVAGLALSTPDQGALGSIGRIDLDLASLDPLGGIAKISSVAVAGVSANRDQWRVPSTEVRDIEIDVAKKTVKVASFDTREATLAVKRRADGSIELPMQAKTDAADSPSEPSPWSVALGKLTVEGYKVSLADASVKPAATHRVTLARLEASDLGTAKGTKSTMTARLATDKGGSIEVRSTFAIDPLALEADIDARRIDLVAFRPYAQHFQTVGLKSANASAKGALKVGGSANAMRISYKGAAEVANVDAIDTGNKDDLLKWDSIHASGVDFAMTQGRPIDLAVANIAVKKAYARVVVLPEGKINLQSLKFATPAQPNPEPTPQPENAMRNVRIDQIEFHDSRLNFTDLFIRPNYTADVGGLEGTVTNLSSDPATRGVVDLKGSYDQSSPVVIAGTVNPLSGNLFLDISAKGKDIELPKLSAYSARYAGYGITQGRLTLDVKYHVEDGKLQGRNKILLDQLTFGDKVESPEATKLPVIFAVNLLKDSKGQIDVELPISGSLADPQFDVGALVVQVVGSLLKRAVTAPFSLLTASFKGDGGNGTSSGGEDLAYVDFPPGLADLTEADRRKLDSISKALADRPAIRIELQPQIDAQKDMDALKRAALQAQLAAAAKDKQPAKEPTKEEIEALLAKIEVPDAELQALRERRAAQVKGYLVEQGKLPADRVLLATAAPGSGGGTPHASRVEFKLR